MTMAEYIERSAAVKAVLRERSPANSVAQNRKLSIIQRDLLTMPAADVVPVVHGQWVDGKCSNCGVDIPTDDAHDAIFETECRFCYYCGAKMDGGADNGAD